jgi:hypothetical protein
MTEAEIEAVARILDADSWAVMDSYLEQTKRKYGGQNVMYDPAQFRHKPSMKLAKAAIAAMPPCNCTVEIVGWLRDDAGKTRADISRLHANHLLTEAQTKEWELLLEIKTGIASAIERGDWKSHD